MKKILLIPALLAVTLLGSCLMELDAQFNTYIPMELPSAMFPLPAGVGTNLVAETGIENMLKDITGEYAEISELSLDWILTNNSTNDIAVAIGITGMSTVSNYAVRFTNYSSYHVPSNNQTVWIIPLRTLTNNEVATGLFVSDSVSPLLRDLMIASNSYQLVIQTIVTNPNLVGIITNDLAMTFAVKQGLTIQRSFADVPGMISLFQ